MLQRIFVMKQASVLIFQLAFYLFVETQENMFGVIIMLFLMKRKYPVDTEKLGLRKPMFFRWSFFYFGTL